MLASPPGARRDSNGAAPPAPTVQFRAVVGAIAPARDGGRGLRPWHAWYADAMSRRVHWEAIYRAFDPEKAAREPELHATRTHTPAPQILADLGRPFRLPKILLTGTTGTGKTTELLAIARQRSAEDFVVVLDLQRHFQDVVGDAPALMRVEAWEVVFLAGLAIVRAASDVLALQFPPEFLTDLESAWRAVAQQSGTIDQTSLAAVDVGGLVKSMLVLASDVAAAVAGGPAITAALKVLEAGAGSVKWSAPIGRAKKGVPDQEGAIHNLVSAVNVLLGHVQTSARRVLLVIDGLDRVTDIAHAKALFVSSSLFGQLQCRLLVAGPFALRHSPELSNVLGFSDMPRLMNEPVLDHREPTRPGPGVGFFCELFERRTRALPADLIDRPALERLAYYSGGRARDFVRAIRLVSERAWDRDVTRVDLAIVDGVIDELRRTRENGLYREDEDALRAVMRDPKHRPVYDARIERLLQVNALLPYPNESEWYYPHPLLTLHFLRD